MYKSMLFLHWKQIRLTLIPLAMAAFGLPLLVIEGLGTPPGMSASSLEAYTFMFGIQSWLPMFPILAAAIGMTLALSAWNWDHQLKHVYALSLPLSRWEYTTAKFVAGAALALIPAAGLWLGAHVASASLSLPAGLNAYPNQLGLRFALAVLLSYGLFSAMAAGTVRTTLVVASVVITFVVVGTMAGEVLGTRYVWFAQNNLVESVVVWLAQAPGPFEVFGGSWSLIDV